MKLIKLTDCNGNPIYINPLNIKRISGNVPYIPFVDPNTLCDIEMIGDDSESYHVVANSIEEVVKLIEDWDK